MTTYLSLCVSIHMNRGAERVKVAERQGDLYIISTVKVCLLALKHTFILL